MDFLQDMYERSKMRAESLNDICGPDETFPVQSLKSALQKKGISVIAEVKYATPAEGVLGLTAKPEELAHRYELYGASAISCLTEPQYFKGELGFIRRIRMVCSIPVMMKDFITDRRQITAGRRQGADAFLLITEMLSLEELGDLFAFGKSLGMDALVEVHGEEGLEKAVSVGARLIGVNCRNLSTLKVDMKTHERMAPLIPEGCVKVAESGIMKAARLKELESMGYDSALIGRAMADENAMKEVLSCG